MAEFRIKEVVEVEATNEANAIILAREQYDINPAFAECVDEKATEESR